jgi:NADH:ubiquinone oxidoreductase subunit D
MRHGFTGVIARGSGIPYDLRYTSPYELYKYIDFNIPVGKNGDCYDRYLVRIQEMRESLSIIHQALSFLSRGPIRYKQSRKITKNSMEELISHFKNYTSYGFFDSNEDYTAIEAPKGELGVYLVSNGKNKPYRCKIRAPGYFHLQGIEAIGKGSFLADIVTIIGTLDIVFGEIDK